MRPKEVSSINALVAYFSASGTTAKAAKAADADHYEIKPAIPYTRADLNWMDKDSRSSVEMNDVAHGNIHPCTGCIHCGYEGPCSQKDDMETIRGKILDADMMVFVTPLYYYGMSAQLKTLADRFCAFNSSIHRKHMKSALLTAAWNSDDWTFDALGEQLS